MLCWSVLCSHPTGFAGTWKGAVVLLFQGLYVCQVFVDLSGDSSSSAGAVIHIGTLPHSYRDGVLLCLGWFLLGHCPHSEVV